MLNSLPRRKRRLLYTTVFGGLFLIVTLLVLWMQVFDSETYNPGEALEGLTNDLGRSLPDDYPRVEFSDVTQESGISFSHFDGTRTSQLPEDMGSGVAWGDYDNDGWVDLFIVNMSGPLTETNDGTSTTRSQLYHNNGDGTFTEKSRLAGVDFQGWGMAAAWADYNNDGWLDLFVTAYGRSVLYRNEGLSDSGHGPSFTDQTRAVGLYEGDGFWAGASWGDYNKDGWLDLYVAGYVKYIAEDGQKTSLQYDVENPASLNPSSFAPERNLLYKNTGKGTFLEVAEFAGVANQDGRSLSATWVDLDEDGWIDLYVANDVSDNVLFRNLGDDTFENISHQALVADYRGAMGIAIGDWDGDSDLDMFVTHWIAQENALYNNTLRGPIRRPFLQFMDQADRFGVGQIALDYIGWGTSFFDYDNDGRLDLFVVNGSTFQNREEPHLLRGMKDQVFWNRDGKDGFYEVSHVSGSYFDTEEVGRGGAFADYDQDGDLDLFVVNHNAQGVLLRNDADTSNKWLKVSLEGVQSNRSAIGARLRLVAAGETQIRQLGAQSSYLSQNMMSEHFGLGDHTLVDTLEVIWPSGLIQRSYKVEVNQTLNIIEGRED